MERYSFTAIDTFKKCPLQFKLRYIDRIRVPTGIEMFLGTCVHKTIEKIHPMLEAGSKIDPSDIEKIYNSVWSQGVEKEDVVIISKEGDLHEYFERGLGGVKWYIQNYEDAGQTLFAELQLEFELEGIRFVAKPDRVTCNSSEKYTIHDYKTSMHKPHSFTTDRQLPMYQYAVKESVDEAKDIELVWHYLCLFERYRLRKSDEEIKSILSSLVNDVHEIESTEKFYPKPSKLCQWCLYWDKCPEKEFRPRKIVDRHVVD